MDQERFAGGEPAALKHVVPDRENGFRDRGGLDHRQARRHRQCVILEGEAVFGVAAADHKRDDLIAKLPAPDPAPDLHDFAGDFQAWNFGGAFGRGIAALRCMTSGRFTPAAMTFTRISPSPGEGTGALVATRTSGPPGSRMAMHVIDFGKWFFDMNTPLFQIPLEVR